MRQRLGRYELLGHLASGGMAHVYIARMTGPGGFARHLVVKAIPDERREDDAFIAMFLDEARLMATLHHQHIAQVFEVGRDDDGTYFLAMEYVHGETARRVLEVATKRRTSLPIEFGLSVTCAAAAGLHHAHERRDLDGTPLGIVHRDVSPSNLIIGYDASVKLIDFGIAKAHTRTTETAAGLVKGKAGYMAPEQVRGEPVDRRSDVFALGILAYELTTQTRAFHGATEFESMRRTIHGEIDPPSRRVANYPAALEDVVMTALATNPEDRFQDADAMRVSLEQVARELGATLGDAPVVRALDKLFPARPEPWFAAAEANNEDEAAASMSLGEPLITVMPGTSSRMRLARGTENLDASVESLPKAEPLSSSSITGELTLDLSTAPFERAPQQLFATPSVVACMPATVRISAPLPLPPTPITPLSMPIPDAVDEPPSLESVDLDPPTIRETVEPVAAAQASDSLQLALATTAPFPKPARVRRRTLRALPLAFAPTTPMSVPVPEADDDPVQARQFAVTAVIAAARPHTHRRVAVAVTAALLLGAIGFAMLSWPSKPTRARHESKAPVVLPSPRSEPPVQQPAVPEARATVMLHVTSDPDGATVVLDGVRLGITPLSIPVGINSGEGLLKVRKQGYAAVKTHVLLDNDVSWDVELRPLRATD